MEALTYYIQVNLVFIALYAAYGIALRRESWFMARRIWLMASLALAFALPLLRPLSIAGGQAIITLPVIIPQASQAVGTGIPWDILLLRAHLLISVILLLRIALHLHRARLFLRARPAEAGSLFGLVHVPDAITGADRLAMLAHEQVHARHGHSIDVLLYRAAAALCWTNPLWWIAFRELRLVHELSADAEARHAHPDYGALLVARALGTSPAMLINSFRTTDIKQRLTMLYTERSPRLARRRLLLALPALSLALALVSWQVSPTPATPLRPPGGEVHQAEFPGGMDALVKYISTNVRYPEAAQADGVQGTVHVAFIVKSTGTIEGVKVMRSVRSDIDAEAVRVVRSMPAWKPARSGSKAVDSEMVLPITFQPSGKK